MDGRALCRGMPFAPRVRRMLEPRMEHPLEQDVPEVLRGFSLVRDGILLQATVPGSRTYSVSARNSTPLGLLKKSKKIPLI